MNSHLISSPVSLSYVAALRGVKPRAPGLAFTYADVSVQDPDHLVCLAASNPEGRFYGVVGDETLRLRAQEQALLRGVSNVSFLRGSLGDILVQAEKGAGLLPPLHYLTCDESEKALSAAERAALFDLVEKLMLPSGLFSYTYNVCATDGGALKFLVREFAPEMNPAQAAEFLLEIKKLGGTYFAGQPALLAKLNQAIARNVPDDFFAGFDEGEARSATFDIMVAMGKRGLAYAGDANIASNYIELSVPSEAQGIVIAARQNHLYEPIKDFALNRKTRSDVWCRQPASTTTNPVQLFGPFCYGITISREKIPTEIIAQGKTIPLTSPLFAKLIGCMTFMPLSIGDFLTHMDGKTFAPEQVLEAVQVLVATGLARAMRGLQVSEHMESLEQPRLSGSFNQYLDKVSVTGSDLRLASPVLGDSVIISAREALIMQALDRGGLANSVSALLPELQRLAQNPSQAARIMDITEPTPETAEHMIKDTVERSIIQWYAYGLLEAA